MSIADGLEFRVVYKGGAGNRGRSVVIKQTAEGAEKFARWARGAGCEVRVDVRQVGPWVKTEVRR